MADRIGAVPVLAVEAPLWFEAVAVRRGLRGLPAATVHRGGMGRRARPGTYDTTVPVVVAGVAGGVGLAIRAGQVVVATEVRTPDGQVRTLCAAEQLAETIGALGLAVHLGPVATVPTPKQSARQRADWAASGVLALDLESMALLAGPDDARRAVVRVISDTADAPLFSPGIIPRGAHALRQLTRLAPALVTWAEDVRAGS